MENDEKRLPQFAPFHIIPTDSPEKRLLQPNRLDLLTDSPEKRLFQPNRLDLLSIPKKSHQFESSFYYDDDNSSSLPPTYDSIFGQFKEDKETKADSLQHLKTVLTMFIGQSK